MNDLINNPPDPSVEGMGDDLPAGLMGMYNIYVVLK